MRWAHCERSALPTELQALIAILPLNWPQSLAEALLKHYIYLCGLPESSVTTSIPLPRRV